MAKLEEFRRRVVVLSPVTSISEFVWRSLSFFSSFSFPIVQRTCGFVQSEHSFPSSSSSFFFFHFSSSKMKFVAAAFSLIFLASALLVESQDDPFPTDYVLTVRLSMLPDYWEEMTSNPESGEYFPANISYDGTIVTNVGVRIKGQSSLRGFALLPFHISLICLLTITLSFLELSKQAKTDSL